MGSFLENKLLGNCYTAIELFAASNVEQYALLEISRKKNELEIRDQQMLTSLDQFGKTNKPVCLVINNNQVLQKEIEGVETDERKLMHRAFPNTNMADFYVQITQFETRSVVALCRRSYVEEVLAKMEGKFCVVSLSLGIGSLSVLRSFSLPDPVQTNTNSVALHAAPVLAGDAVSPADSYQVNGLEISGTYLLGFSAILEFLLKVAHMGNITEVNTGLLDKILQRAFFEKGVKIALVFLFGLLLANFFTFSYFFDRSFEMQQAVTHNQAGIANITKLKGSIREKAQQLETFTAQSSSKSSLLINEMIKIMPLSVLLSEVSYYPLAGKPKENEAIAFQEKLLLVSGSTTDHQAFTMWLRKMQFRDEIDTITITSFGKNSDGLTEFDLKIILE